MVVPQIPATSPKEGNTRGWHAYAWGGEDRAHLFHDGMSLDPPTKCSETSRCEAPTLGASVLPQQYILALDTPPTTDEIGYSALLLAFDVVGVKMAQQSIPFHGQQGGKKNECEVSALS